MKRALPGSTGTAHARDVASAFLATHVLGFAAVVSAGVFTEGHAPLCGLDELVRVTRAGGYVVFSIARAYLEGSFDEKRKSLEAAGRWRFVEASRRYNSTPLEGDIPARVYAFQVI